MVGLIAMMFPFIMPWYDGNPSLTNLDGILNKPAGIHGFIRSKNGHLFEGDERIRFVGMIFSQSGNLPATKWDAEAIAGRLAKYGINCVRLAALDYRPTPDGIFQSDGRTLDPVAMNRVKRSSIRLQYGQSSRPASWRSGSARRRRPSGR